MASFFCHAVAVTKQVRLERFVGRDGATNPQPPQAGLECDRIRIARPRGESLSVRTQPKRPPGHAQCHRQLSELTEDGKAGIEPSNVRREVDRRTRLRAKRYERRRDLTATNCS